MSLNIQFEDPGLGVNGVDLMLQQKCIMNVTPDDPFGIGWLAAGDPSWHGEILPQGSLSGDSHLMHPRDDGNVHSQEVLGNLWWNP
jgi:hypothetical protein